MSEMQDGLLESVAEFHRGNKAAWPMWELVVEAFGPTIADDIWADVLLDWFKASLDLEAIEYAEKKSPFPLGREERLAAAFDHVGVLENHRKLLQARAFEQVLFLDEEAAALVKASEGATDRVAAIRAKAWDKERRYKNDVGAFTHPAVVKRALEQLGS
jgi:hypothetical protein